MICIQGIDDGAAWNALALEFSTADVRQSYEWGELRRRQGWRSVRLAAFLGDRCPVALAVQVRRVPGLGTLAYAPRGPLMEPGDEAAAAALPDLLRAIRRQTGAAFLRVSPGSLNGTGAALAARLEEAGFAPLPEWWTLWNTPRNVMRLTVAGSERELLAQMARKRRQHISTAPKKSMTADFGAGLEDLRRFYALLVDHATRHRYPARDWGSFEALHAAFAPAGALALIRGRVQGEVVAALLGIRFGPVAYSLYAPSTPAARGTAVGDVVHWEWLRWAQAAGCREVDFGSSGTAIPPRETDVSFGIYRFKVELGCRLDLCPAYHDYVFEPLRYRIVRAVERSPLSRARYWLARLPAGVRAAIVRRMA